MPTIFSARGLAECALQNIRAFPVTDDAADPAQLRRALQRLELIMNDTLGQQTVASAWKTLEIPLTADKSRYRFADYTDDNGIQFAYDTFLQRYNDDGLPIDECLLTSVTERRFNQWDKSGTGDPSETFIDRTNDTYLNIFPSVSPTLEDGKFSVKVQIQSFATKITQQGTGGVNINFRPTWYLYLINKLSYELGKGSIRRLPRDELEMYQKDFMLAEPNLISGDVAQITGLDSCTQPWGQ